MAAPLQYQNPPSPTATLESVTLADGNLSEAVSAAGAYTKHTPLAPTAASVGVTSGSALAANTSRTGLILVNTSSNTISIAFGTNPAVLYSGITLEPNGGTYEMDVDSFTSQAVNAIASGSGSNLAIQEYN